MKSDKKPTFNELTKDVEDGKWVVLSLDETELLAEGFTSGEAMAKAKETGAITSGAYRIRRF